eukprot:436904-Amphidinium_carterae.1
MFARHTTTNYNSDKQLYLWSGSYESKSNCALEHHIGSATFLYKPRRSALADGVSVMAAVAAPTRPATPSYSRFGRSCPRALQHGQKEVPSLNASRLLPTLQLLAMSQYPDKVSSQAS